MPQRKVLIISYYFPPHSSVGVQRPSQIAKYSPQSGWEPIVLTVEPEGYRARSEINDSSQPPKEVPVYRTRIRRPAREITHLGKRLMPIRQAHAASVPQPEAPTEADRPSGSSQQLGRFIDLFLGTPDEEVGWLPFAVSAGIKLIRRHEIDVIYTTSPPHSAHLAGHVLSRLTGLPWVVDYQDPWSLDPWKQEIRPSLEQWVHIQMERGVLDRADRLIFNTENAMQAYIDCYDGGVAKKSCAIPNGFDPDDMQDFGIDPTKAESSTKLTLLHAGSLYGKRNPFPVIKAVQQLHQQGILSPDNFHLTFLGSAKMEVEATELIHRSGLAQMIELVPPVPREECFRAMLRSEMLLILQPGTQLQIPAKLYEYVQLRKPIMAITETDGALASIMRKHRTGVLVTNEIQDIMEGLTQALHDFRNEWGNSGHTEFPLELYQAPYLTRRITEVFSEAYTHQLGSKGR